MKTMELARQVISFEFQGLHAGNADSTHFFRVQAISYPLVTVLH